MLNVNVANFITVGLISLIFIASAKTVASYFDYDLSWI
jgi:hypothetical protein